MMPATESPAIEPTQTCSSVALLFAPRASQGVSSGKPWSPTTTPKQEATSQEIIEELWKSKLKLHGRCLTLFSKLTDAHTRIAELESVISAMRYAEKPIDFERCGPCETGAFASDA